ncbi:MAG TPA: hypothetical protein VLF71_02020 [Candidatus Saccharimonadales bacterium]|nr:hypothetical protein [Candidatus Saccharimonadales bacterium]
MPEAARTLPLSVRLAGAALATAGAASLASCGFAPQPHGPVDVNPGYLGAPANTPHGVCERVPGTDQEEHDNAARCATAMKGAKVALVTFGVSAPEAQKLAAGTAELVHRVTEGLITLDVTVVPASPEAVQALAAAASPDCVDTQQVAHMASAAADQTMPQLAAADFVLAANSAPSCSRKIAGVADYNSGRRADIYGAGSNPPVDAENAAHELLHDFGLGHAGLQTPDSNNVRLRYTGKGTSVDLRTYLTQQSTFAEYGMPGDIMGGGGTTFAHSDPLDLAFLEWPQGVLGGPAADPIKRLQHGEWTTLSAQDAGAGDLITGRLQESAFIKDDDAAQATDGNVTAHAFTDLSVVPNVFRGHISGAELYLSDADHAVDLVGRIVDDNLRTGTDDMFFVYGSQRWEMRFSDGGLSLRELTATQP